MPTHTNTTTFNYIPHSDTDFDTTVKTIKGRDDNDNLMIGSGNNIVIGGKGGDSYIFNSQKLTGKNIIRDSIDPNDNNKHAIIIDGKNILEMNWYEQKITEKGEVTHKSWENGDVDPSSRLWLELTNDPTNQDEKVFILRGENFEGSIQIPAEFLDLDTNIMVGDNADNVITGDEQNETIYGNDGNDTLHGGEGRDGLSGGNGDDVLYGGADNDALHGGNGDDVLYGGDGDDILTSGTGDNVLNGGNGSDTYYFDSQTLTGKNVIVDSGNQDKIMIDGKNIITDFAWIDDSYTGVNGFIFKSWYTNDGLYLSQSYNGSDPDDKIFVLAGDNFTGRIDIPASFIEGKIINHQPTIINNIDDIHITEGNSFSIDLDDYFTDKETANLDYQITSNGSELPNWINFDEETNILSTSSAQGFNDLDLSIIAIDEASSQVNSHVNILVTEQAIQAKVPLFGGELVGKSGDDTLIGSWFNDNLSGGFGDDTINGGFGNDTIKGGLGNDDLYGGKAWGKDSFVFDTRLGADNVDTIHDFSHFYSKDTIVLDSDIFTNLDKGALQADNFALKTSDFIQDDNDYIIFDQATGQLQYDADANGVGEAVTFANVMLHDTAFNLDASYITVI